MRSSRSSKRTDLRGCKLGIFDFNGTLANDLWLALENVYNTFRFFKTNYEPTVLARAFREQITCNFSQFYHDNGIPECVSAEEINREKAIFFGKNYQHVSLRKGVVETLDHCLSAGVDKMTIVSGEVHHLLERMLGEWGIRKFFPGFWADIHDKSSTLGEVCETLRVDPSDVFYVDDTVEGIEASRNNGITSVSLVNPTSYAPVELLLAAKPDIAIAEISDIIGLL